MDILVDPSKSNEQISDSGLTVGWVLENLFRSNQKFREALGDGKVKEVFAHDIGLSYRTSVVFNNTGKTPYAFEMKIPKFDKFKNIIERIIGDAMPEEHAKMHSDWLMKGHNAECDFYEQFRFVKPLPLPEVWLTKKIDKDFASPGVIMMEDLRKSTCVGLPTVLCHGHLHRSNALFLKNEGGANSGRVAAFVDWEMVNHGNPLYDLASHIAFCADAEVRREAETFVVQYYLDELVRLMRESGSSLKDDITVEKLTQAYKLATIYAAVQSVSSASMLKKANKAKRAGLDAFVQYALIALRTKLLLTDALQMAEECEALDEFLLPKPSEELAKAIFEISRKVMSDMSLGQ